MWLFQVIPHKSFVPKEFNFIGSYAGLEVNFKVLLYLVELT